MLWHKVFSWIVSRSGFSVYRTLGTSGYDKTRTRAAGPVVPSWRHLTGGWPDSRWQTETRRVESQI